MVKKMVVICNSCEHCGKCKYESTVRKISRMHGVPNHVLHIQCQNFNWHGKVLGKTENWWSNL